MSTVLLAPHNDDETLFAAYTLMRERPHVVVCTRAEVDHHLRERETQESLYRLTGSETYEQWTFSDRTPDWQLVARAIEALADEHDVVWAPASNGHRNGHSHDKPPPPHWGVLQHDHIGQLAARTFGPERTRRYCLYTRWDGRDDQGTLVEPTGMEIARKLEALSMYVSQIEQPTTRPWFYDQLDMREWVIT